MVLIVSTQLKYLKIYIKKKAENPQKYNIYKPKK
jgi:hypothetical protein